MACLEMLVFAPREDLATPTLCSAPQGGEIWAGLCDKAIKLHSGNATRGGLPVSGFSVNAQKGSGPQRLNLGA